MALLKPFKTGVAYHSNRILRHAEEDMRELVKQDMNLVVHMFTHNDMERHRNVMKDILSASEQLGLETWVDNWGIEGGPGDKAHFLAYHPEARMVNSDNTPQPIKACYNNEAFLAFTFQWLDMVREAGGKTIFWDEPYIPCDASVYACACPVCRRLFEERYNKTMPVTLTEEVTEFRTLTVENYFRRITAYASSLGLVNTVCVMFNPLHGISLDNLDHIGGIGELANIGCDPYWYGSASGTDVYGYVYERTKKNIDFCGQHRKDHNIWIQAFGAPAGREDEIILACDAAYDAGARTIIGWSFRGGESNDYRCAHPEKAWAALCTGLRRQKNRYFDAIHQQCAADVRT